MPDVEPAEGRLYDVIDTSTPTLLVKGGAEGVVDAAAPWAEVISVRTVSLPHELVRGSGWLLVRPDGYLAAAGYAADAHRLRAWLNRWLTPLEE